MKGVVAYDSVYGNTKLVAEAIAEQIKSSGHEVELVFIGSGVKSQPSGDFMFVGSPTRVGRMTKPTKEFIAGLDHGTWQDNPLVMFDTVGPLSKEPEKRNKWLERIDKSAATKMMDIAREKGLRVHPEPLHIAVTGFKGPLAPDALDMAKSFASKFLATME